MPKLTMQDINRAVGVARSLGLSEQDVLALQESLIARNLDLTGEQRLAFEIAQLDGETQAEMESFVEKSAQMVQKRQKRGTQALNDIPDSQWNELVNEALEENE